LRLGSPTARGPRWALLGRRATRRKRHGWSHALAFCVPSPTLSAAPIRAMGADAFALRREDRDAPLFDLGVAIGATRLCVRTRDVPLVAALEGNTGRDLLGNHALIEQIVRAQPHRVLLSPAGRIEVFQPIPMRGGKSPAGPHTHVLPKLIAKRRSHSSNVPLPEDWQPVLTAHPPSPWPLAENSQSGHARFYHADSDAAFVPLLRQYGVAEAKEIRDAITAAVASREDVSAFPWPKSRQGRIAARVTLRRLAAAGVASAASWRAARDNVRSDEDPDQDRDQEE
jgi:hypothetical protein